MSPPKIFVTFSISMGVRVLSRLLVRRSCLTVHDLDYGSGLSRDPMTRPSSGSGWEGTDPNQIRLGTSEVRIRPSGSPIGRGSHEGSDETRTSIVLGGAKTIDYRPETVT